MRIIVIQPYTIESYYRCENVIPIEYSSIEELRQVIQKAFDKYLIEKEQHFVASQEWHKEIRLTQEKHNYAELVKQHAAVQKQYNRACGSTPKVNRTPEWHANNKKLKEQENDLFQKIEAINHLTPPPPAALQDELIIGKLVIRLAELQYEDTKLED